MTPSNHQIYLEEINERIDQVEHLHYQPVEPLYRNVQMILTAITYFILAGLALLLLLLDNPVWCLIAEGIIIASLAANLFILRKAWIFKGYALREYDLSYRSGIIFPTITTIPFNRMQQVGTKQNPISKIFKLYSVEVVNGAQLEAAISIPGLTEEKANQIKNIIIEKMRDE